MRVIAAGNDDSFTGLFLAAHHSARHLEVRDNYAVSEEADAFRAWRADGRVVETEADREWTSLVRTLAARGVTVTRLRIVSIPPSEYIRWLVATSTHNIAAGEEIRWLPRDRAEGPVPLDDWWLFDRNTAGFTTFDDNDAYTGLAVSADPAVAKVCVEAWDRLWPQGIDHARFANSEFALR
ncbi:DUF6879 family protein [Nocardia thraciensis]